METHSPFRNTETLENKEKMSESESITEAGQSFAESLGVADQVEFFDGTKLLITSSYNYPKDCRFRQTERYRFSMIPMSAKCFTTQTLAFIS